MRALKAVRSGRCVRGPDRRNRTAVILGFWGGPKDCPSFEPMRSVILFCRWKASTGSLSPGHFIVRKTQPNTTVERSTVKSITYTSEYWVAFFHKALRSAAQTNISRHKPKEIIRNRMLGGASLAVGFRCSWPVHIFVCQSFSAPGELHQSPKLPTLWSLSATHLRSWPGG